MGLKGLKCSELLDCWEGAEETDCGPMAGSTAYKNADTSRFFHRELCEEEQGAGRGDILVPLWPSCSLDDRFHSLYLHFISAHCDLREALSAELCCLNKTTAS